MSSRDVQPALLILSNNIYAKRSDGNFYPGSIETKLLDGTFVVKFQDSSKERVEEEDITWLGFWGLPPWTWPKSPVIYPATCPSVSAVNERGLNSGNDEPRKFAKFYEEKSEPFKERIDNLDLPTSWQGCSVSPSAKTSCGSPTKRSPDENSSHVLPRQTSPNQSRSSVLRIYRNGNLKRAHETLGEALDSEKDNLGPSGVKSRRPSQSCQEEDHVEEEPLRPQNVNDDFSVRTRREFSECQESSLAQVKDPRYKLSRSCSIPGKVQDTASFQAFNPFSIISSLQASSFPFGIYIHSDSTLPAAPSSFRLQTSNRRRQENKKCRKVYGIENRDMWCTQCKWKKACTRFVAFKSDERNSLIADDDGFSY